MFEIKTGDFFHFLRMILKGLVSDSFWQNRKMSSDEKIKNQNWAFKLFVFQMSQSFHFYIEKK